MLEKDLEFMKAFRNLLLTGMVLAGLVGTGRARAQTASSSAGTTPPPVVLPHNGTTGVPPGVRTLITSFDQTRDHFLATQAQLQSSLKNATTAAQRQQIREQLQANRQAFLEALKSFREKLQVDLAALKGKISHEEYLRIIDAAHDATTEGGLSHHKGH